MDLQTAQSFSALHFQQLGTVLSALDVEVEFSPEFRTRLIERANEVLSNDAVFEEFKDIILSVEPTPEQTFDWLSSYEGRLGEIVAAVREKYKLMPA